MLSGTLFRRIVIGLALVGAVGAANAVLGMGGHGAGSKPVATVRTFTGVLDVKRSGAADFTGAYADQPVVAGDVVRAEADSKGAIIFPDGSIMRIDSFGEIRIARLDRAANGTWSIGLAQLAGWSWIVPSATHAPSFRVDAPNGSTVNARGTELSVLTGLDGSGSPLVVVDVWKGSAQVTRSRQRVEALSGQTTAIPAQTSVTTPHTIPSAHWQSPWTVFNRTLDSVPGSPITFTTNVLSPGAATEPQAGAVADGRSDLAYTVGSAASLYEITVLDPEQREFQSFKAAQSAVVTLIVPRPRLGDWGYRIRNVRSSAPAVWWLIVSEIRPATHTPRPFFPTANACEHRVSANGTDQWTITALDALGAPAMTASGLPDYATFNDNGDGSASLVFRPGASTSARDVIIPVSASLGGVQAQVTCVEHIRNPANDATQTPPAPTPPTPDSHLLLSPPPTPSPKLGGGPSPDQLPTPAPAPSPSASGTPSPTAAPTPTPTPSPAPTPTPSPTDTAPPPTPSPTDTAPPPTPSPTDTPPPTPPPTPDPTPPPTPDPTPPPTPDSTPLPTPDPTPPPTADPTPAPSAS
ncbi:MAG: hypothetical protein ABI401_04640 [Candidatus Dormibacter sp.]